MSDQTPHKPSLTEISHLFLSSVREKQTNGAPRPQRIAPGQPRLAPPPPVELAPAPEAAPLPELAPEPESIAMPIPMPQHSAAPDRSRSVDMTPEEFMRTFGEASEASAASEGEPARRMPPIAAVLASHIANSSARVKDYARQLAVEHGRIGLIEVDVCGLRVATFDAGEPIGDEQLEQPAAGDSLDRREMAEALDELNWDVDRWLLSIANPRTPEARGLLGAVHHWVLLSTGDHDGVVSSYRMIKGLAEGARPHVSLALLDVADDAERQRVFQKLSGVCQQFLNLEVAEEPAVGGSSQVIETVALCCRPTPEQGQIAAAPQWEIVDNFLQSLKPALPEAAVAQVNHNPVEVDPMHAINEPFEQTSEAKRTATVSSAPSFEAMSYSASHAPAQAGRRDTHVDVIDLPAEGGSEAILGAILRQNQSEFVECPVRAPMCEGARLAITRDRGIVLLAVAREGLSELRAIGHAYRWISENRTLIAMAIPQFAIDPNQTPRLRLLVDHADASADVLHQIMQAEHVTIQAYRKLRWGGKTGLFLEAA